MTLPLMPRATAVWLVDNTGLTFDQIAEFTGLHPLEVQGVADGEISVGLQGADPLASLQLTADEIKRCEADPSARLKLAESDSPPPRARTKGQRYTPVSKRHDRPSAILWLLRYHPEISDTQVSKLVGTTKPTIGSVRDRTHWNIQQLKPNDPVSLGLCTQQDLDDALQKAQEKEHRRLERVRKGAERKARDKAAAGAAALPDEPAQLDTLDEVDILNDGTLSSAAAETAMEPEPDSDLQSVDDLQSVFGGESKAEPSA
jgi:hypothetical protein